MLSFQKFELQFEPKHIRSHGRKGRQKDDPGNVVEGGIHGQSRHSIGAVQLLQ